MWNEPFYNRNHSYYICTSSTNKMPPKVYKKPNRETNSQKSKSDDMNERAQISDKWDINLMHVLENTQTLERIHTLTSILSGAVAGLFNANLYSGIFTYVCLHVIMTALIAAQVGKVTKYFAKSTELLSGLGSGILVFICIWIFVYNVVYIL